MSELIRLFLLYGHLMAFAVTVSAIVIEDYRLITRGYGPSNLARLRATSRIVMPGTAVLLITGLGLCAVDTGMDWSVIATRSKLLAKLSVVGVLLINGAVLHTLAFPALQRKSDTPRRTAIFLCMTGSISSVSWLYASFLGIAKPLATRLQWSDFITLYLFLVAMAFTAAVLITGPQLVKHLRPKAKRTHTRPQDSLQWV